MQSTVTEIRSLLRAATADEFPALEHELESDSRKGVQTALNAARRRLAAEAAEQERIRGMYAFDRSHRLGGRLVVGLDEVGRGAVAGPLAVGAVVLPDDPLVEDLNDSKQLTPERREAASKRIKSCALAYAVHYVEPALIDANGMAWALRTAFCGALAAIDAQGLDLGTVLIDGNPLDIDSREVNVVKGDATSASIAAASIIAKVDRDNLMRSLAPRYPQYGFQQNKGYASELHVQAIRDNGLSPVHRASFCNSFLQQTLF